MAWMRIVIHHMRNVVGIVVGRVGVGCNLMWNCFMFCRVVLYVSVSP